MAVEAIVTLLEASAAVTALVGDRITPEWRKQGDPLPALTVAEVSAVRSDELLAAFSLTASRIQVDCWAGSYAQAKALSRAVRDTLDQQSGIIAGVQVERISLSDFRDLGEKTGDKSIRRVSLDFNVWYQEQ